MTTSPNRLPRVVALLIDSRKQVVFAVLALCVIVVLDSSIFYLLPYDGALIDFGSNKIIQMDKGGPAQKAGALFGDQILKIDGRSVNKWGLSPSYRPGIQAGDTLIYEIRRANQTLYLPVVVDSLWQHPGFLLTLIGLQFLSIAFWTLGILLCLFVPRDDVRARLVGLLWLFTGVVVAAGGPGSATNFWGARMVFPVALCLLAFVGVTAHLYFPVPAFSSAHRDRIVNFLAGVSLLFAIASAAHDLLRETNLISGTDFFNFVEVLLLFSMLAIVGLLFRSRFLIKEPNTRRQTNIVLWGTIFGFAPFLIFTLLPIILFGNGHEYIDGNNSVLFLVFLPLAYAYTIQQRKLLKIDLLINRLVVFFVLSLLVLLISFTTLGMVAVVFDLPTQVPLIGGLMATLMVLPASTFQNLVQVKVNQILYGSHYDHVLVTSSLSSRLAQTNDRTNLTKLLTQSLAQQMGIQQTTLLLAEGERLEQQSKADAFTAALSDEMCKFLLESNLPVRSQNLWGSLTTQTQARWRPFLWGQLFTPIIFENQLRGILILGDRVAGEVYSDMDVKIIAAVAQQAAVAAANVQLVETLRGLTQQMVRSEETQRKQVARDLHDFVLQDLFFFKQKLAEQDEKLATHLDHTIDILRNTIKAQRPSLLDHGLPIALQDLVTDMGNLTGEAGPTIRWQRQVDSVHITDEQATSVYRITYEAIINALKHARAEHIIVSLAQNDGNLVLCVQDDGMGMTNMQAPSERFGMVGMRERAMMIGAQLRIVSSPGEGTQVTLEVNP